MKPELRLYTTFLLFLIATLPHHAQAANIIALPYVEKSVVTLTWRGDITTDNESNSQNGAWKQKLLAGYGVTDRLYVAIGGLQERTGGHTPDMNGAELLTKYQITPTGEYWLDSGVLLDYKKSFEKGPDSVTARLLLAKKTGDFLHVANFNIQRNVGEDAERTINTGFLVGTRYIYNAVIQPGAEFQDTFGTVNRSLSFASSSDEAGPVLYGNIGGGFRYEIGYLIGLSHASPQGNAKALLSYSFKL